MGTHPSPSPRFASSCLGAACAMVVTFTAAEAAASDPFALYASPTAVELLPDAAAATRVVIHGAILFLTVPQSTSGAFVYNEPRCGTMYFQCAAGEEDLCRMQWRDLQNAVGRTYCAGFGTLNMLSNATFWPEGTAPVKPDKWEMGMGVAIAGFLGGACPKALALKCSTPAPDAGTGEAGASGAGGLQGASGAGGLGDGGQGQAGSPGGRAEGSGGGLLDGAAADGGSGGAGASSGSTGQAAEGNDRKSPKGCSLQTPASSWDALLALGIFLCSFETLRRRR